MDRQVAAIDLDDTMIDTYTFLLNWAIANQLIQDAPPGGPTTSDGYARMPDEIIDRFMAEGRDTAIPPLEWAAAKCDILKGNGWKLYIVTARHPKQLRATSDFVATTFPNIFEEVICTGHTSKGDALQRIGAKFFLDDNPGQVACAEEAGVPSILFGDLPWNRGVRHTRRAADWIEAGTHIEGLESVIPAAGRCRR